MKWCQEVQKELPLSLTSDVAKWLESVAISVIGNNAAVSFFRPPPEHRVIVTSNDVRQLTGKYYVRNFGGASFATESDGANLYCAVTAKSVVPNYNLNNINLECRAYTKDLLSEGRAFNKDLPSEVFYSYAH